MKPSDDHDSLIRLILGELPEDERERLESRLLAEPDLLEQAAAAEAELADAYARGQMGSGRRAAWEARVRASARMRDRTAFARAFAHAAGAPARASERPRLLAWLLDPPRLLGPALAASLALAVSGAAWLALELQSARRELAVRTAERDTLRAEADGRGERRVAEQAEVATPGPRIEDAARAEGAPPRRSFVTLALGLGSLRGAVGLPRVVLSPAVDSVRLEADLEGAEVYRRLRAVVRSAAGETVLRQGRVVTRSAHGMAAAEVTVPSRVLRPGDYVLVLEGLRVGGDWEMAALREFRVERR